MGRAAVLEGPGADALPADSSCSTRLGLHFVMHVDACFKTQILLSLRCGEASGQGTMTVEKMACRQQCLRAEGQPRHAGRTGQHQRRSGANAGRGKCGGGPLPWLEQEMRARPGRRVREGPEPIISEVPGAGGCPSLSDTRPRGRGLSV